MTLQVTWCPMFLLHSTCMLSHVLGFTTFSIRVDAYPLSSHVSVLGNAWWPLEFGKLGTTCELVDSIFSWRRYSFTLSTSLSIQLGSCTFSLMCGMCFSIFYLELHFCLFLGLCYLCMFNLQPEAFFACKIHIRSLQCPSWPILPFI